MKLIYIANARLPTEKAHGYQICKMCEAFAQNEVEVILFHPQRYQTDIQLKNQTIFQYYSISESFEIRTLNNIDLIVLNLWLPSKIFPFLFLFNSILWALYAVLEAKKEKADLYFTRDLTVAFWLTKLGLPTICEVHTIPKKVTKWFLQQLKNNGNLKLLVVLTSFLKKELIGLGFSDQNIHIAPDSVDLLLFKNLPTKQECRQKLGLPEHRKIIGYIGRFRTMEMEKGIPELVQAMGKLPCFNENEPLLLCVGGPMNTVKNYLELAHKNNIPNNRFQFRDRVANIEVPLWLKACDILTIPWQWNQFSAYYTSPMKLFEYMATGNPIIASDLPSIKEILSHNQNALLCTSGDIQAIADSIKLLLENPEFSDKIAQQALLDVQNNTWYARANKIIQSWQNTV